MVREFIFNAHSLNRHEEIGNILNAALAAADPRQVVKRYLHLEGTSLIVGEKEFELGTTRRIRVVGAGKASVAMLQALVEIMGEHIDSGLVIAKNVPDGIERIGSVEVLAGSHPVTSMKSVLATQRMIASLEGLSAEDIVICLISGGGSALMTDPKPGVSLEDLQSLNRLLLACGADIEDFNTLRKHLDRIKGGGLRRITAPAEVISLIISDVIGSRLEVIASGPTAPDPSTFIDAQRVVEKFSLMDEIPRSILDVLKRGVAGEIEETLKPGDPIFKRTHHFIVGDNRQAALAGIENARALGMNTLLLTTSMQGEARCAGKFLANVIQQIRLTGEPIPPPACIIAGGETTVTLRGNGYGGRNQELALGAVSGLAGQRDIVLVTLATDGEDGPTDAAGAVVTGETMQRAQTLGMNPEEFIIENNAYRFFERLDDLLRPGSTGTNVNDLAFGFVY